MEKIAISTSSFGKYDRTPIEECQNAGYAVISNPYGRKVTSDELVGFAYDAVGLIAGTERLFEDVLKQLSKLKVISRCGTGLDNIDLDVAARCGIKVFNTPDAPTQAVAELTVGLILACLRHIPETDLLIRKGPWRKIIGTLLQSKKVGIIGYGRIGRAVSRIVQAFGAQVIAYDIADIPETEGMRMVSFNEVLTEADIITLHIPMTPSKEPLITAENIGKMKKGAYLINTSRGQLVDESALYNALKSGRLSGAALDTFYEEPYKGPLCELNNIVLTAHIGSYEKETRILMEKQAVKNLLKGLR